jgi:hypothetical protein
MAMAGLLASGLHCRKPSLLKFKATRLPGSIDRRPGLSIQLRNAVKVTTRLPRS